MSHISKGDVHAYLDGALGAYPDEAAAHVREHLNACRECAQLLEGERRLRKDASAILAASAQGQVELDPFEELLARAAESDRQERAEGAEGSERARSARPLLGSRLYSLRWAAMVVVSLGAGWMARDLTGPAGDLARDAGSELVVQQIESAADQERLERDGAAVPAVTDALPDGLPDGLPASPAVVAERRADIDTPSDADPTSDLQVAATRFQAPAPPESPGAAAASSVRLNADPAAGGFAGDVVLDQVVAAVEAPPARQLNRSAAARTVGAADRDARARVSQLSDLAAPRSADVSRSTTPFLVPGLRVLDVRLAPGADDLPGGESGTSMIVTQELEDGRIIELEFVPGAASDPAFGVALQERDDLVGRTGPVGWSTAVREVPGGVAVLSGPLAPSALEDLLDRALGPR